MPGGLEGGVEEEQPEAGDEGALVLMVKVAGSPRHASPQTAPNPRNGHTP